MAFHGGGGTVPPAVLAASIVDSIYYQDPNRVKQDTTDLLKEVATLMPERETWTDPTGASVPLLCLKGTVPVNYRGNTYNIPLVIWVQEGHPRAPPQVYVNPTRDMEVKRGHRCVAPDGSCMLDAWDPSTSKLVTMVRYLQGQFSADPPVYARRTDTAPTRAALQEAITQKLQAKMHTLFSKTRAEIDDEFDLQSRLETSALSIDSGVHALRDSQRALEAHAEALNVKVVEVESWLVAQSASADSEGDADSIVQPPDELSKQLLRLVAEDAACEDCLGEMDMCLRKGNITSAAFVKEVRNLARQQFEARALAIKICDAQRAAGYGLAGAGRK